VKKKPWEEIIFSGFDNSMFDFFLFSEEETLGRENVLCI